MCRNDQLLAQLLTKSRVERESQSVEDKCFDRLNKLSLQYRKETSSININRF